MTFKTKPGAAKPKPQPVPTTTTKPPPQPMRDIIAAHDWLFDGQGRFCKPHVALTWNPDDGDDCHAVLADLAAWQERRDADTEAEHADRLAAVGRGLEGLAASYPGVRVPTGYRAVAAEDWAGHTAADIEAVCRALRRTSKSFPPSSVVLEALDARAKALGDALRFLRASHDRWHRDLARGDDLARELVASAAACGLHLTEADIRDAHLAVFNDPIGPEPVYGDKAAWQAVIGGLRAGQPWAAEWMRAVGELKLDGDHDRAILTDDEYGAAWERYRDARDAVLQQARKMTQGQPQNTPPVQLHGVSK
jgi:hypothetical protein